MRITAFKKSGNTMTAKIIDNENCEFEYSFPFIGTRTLTDDERLTREQKEKVEFNVRELYAYITTFGLKDKMFIWHQVNEGSYYAHI